MFSSGWNQWRQRALSAGAATAMVVSLSASTLGTLPIAALGLGEIDTRSALNERFSAEIELLDTRGLDSSEVLASLASSDDFRRVGVERFFFLTNLKFDVTRNARGNLVIKATSQKPITEPYLNFLVEVLWPSGRLLKEYTVLLDPPTFTHSAAAPVAAPSREQTDVASSGRIQRDPAPVNVPAQPRPVTSTSSAGRVARAANDNTYGRTNRSDTMWAIANDTLPSTNVTPQQNMLAIQRLNPDAFIDGNVNLLKAGVVLRLPNEAEASALSSSAAVAEISQQTQAWRNGAPSRTLANADSATQSTAPTQTSATIDATSRGPGDAGSASTTNDGRLRIVAAEATGPVDSIDNAGSSDNAIAQVGDPAAKERLAELNRQVDELTYQLDLQKRGVEEQISERDNTINLKDQQIAQLEAQLKALRETAANAAQAKQDPTQTAASAPDVEAKPWWQQTSILGGALGLLTLLLAGVFFSRRRNADTVELDDLDVDEPSFELGDSPAIAAATPLADAELLGDLEDADAALGVDPIADHDEDLSESLASDELSDEELFGPADDAKPAPSDDEAQTSDVIGEADIYIAYGRYPQAIALLQGAVEANPDDHPVRMRLLEVAAETNDIESYATHAAALQEHCSDPETLATAKTLHESLDSDLRDQIDALGDHSGATGAESEDSGLLSGAGLAAGAAALTAGAASVFGDDSTEQTDDAVEEPLIQEEFQDDVLAADSSIDDDNLTVVEDAEPFAFDTTVTAVEADTEALADDGLDSSLEDLAAELPDSDATEDEFELDLDLKSDEDSSVDLNALTDEIADDAAADFDLPAVNTDQFSTNVDIAPAEDAASAVDDFELDLDLDETSGAELAELEEAVDNLGGDLGLDFPDETSELERVVAETDDDQLLDEIERSLDELETDGLLSPELSDDGDFSFDDDADTSATKLDLARAYIDMGDDDGAREILGEVITEGDTDQKGEANELLDKL